jgi:hypothetical protein
MLYYHLDLVVVAFLSILFIDLTIHFLSSAVCHLGFFITLAITLFIVSRYLIKDIVLMLSSINIIIT